MLPSNRLPGDTVMWRVQGPPLKQQRPVSQHYKQRGLGSAEDTPDSWQALPWELLLCMT